MATTSDFNAYQKDVQATAVYPKGSWDSYLPLQLAAEAGEVAGKFGKAARKGEPVDYKAVALELGDVLWYVSELSRILGYNLSEIAKMNTDKLNSRLQRGTIHGEGDNR